MMDLISPTLRNIKAYCDCSGMYSNGERAEAMLFALNNRLQSSSFPPIHYDGQDIRLSDTLRHLVVIFDRQLNFSEHVNSVLHRGIKAANILKVAAGRKVEERHLVMLYKSLVLSVVGNALPMINISQNLMGKLERLQNTCLRIITWCPRSTPVHALQYLVRVPSIETRQKLVQATITCKALEESRHGLRGVISKELTALQAAQQNAPALPHLRPRNRTTKLLHRLRRKPWTSQALSATFELSGIHYLSHSPAWISPELHDEEPTVIINFNRDCRVWPRGAANSAFSQLLSDISSGTDSILVATDDSFDPATNRAGWGFAIFSNGELIQQGAGAQQVFTSSTRMELEAVRNALKAVKDMIAPPTIIVATDSMAILCKIQSGYLPGEWFVLRDDHPTTEVIWVFVSGHSGVTCNETADMLASSCSNFTPLNLFPSEL